LVLLQPDRKLLEDSLDKMNDSSPNIPDSLESARIKSLPPSFYYIPNFITPAESNALLQKVRISSEPFDVALF
jgi:hypothetical protein